MTTPQKTDWQLALDALDHPNCADCDRDPLGQVWLTRTDGMRLCFGQEFDDSGDHLEGWSWAEFEPADPARSERGYPPRS